MARLIYNDFKKYNEQSKLQTKEAENTYLPWVERFRPEKLCDVISNEQITSTFKDYVKNKYLPHLLICGPSGVGKTSIVMALAKELYGDSYMLMTKHINASEERGIEVIRNKVKDFVMSSIFLPGVIPFKLVILDEADAMTISAQGMLRRIIEDFTSSARFCLICNKLKSIDPAIQSRCVNFRFAPLQPEIIKKRIKEICINQKINIDSDGLDLLIKISGGDMRKVFNNLQSIYMAFNKITYITVAKCTGYPTDEQIILILNTLLNKSLDVSLKIILDIIQENQYNLLDIITEITIKLREQFLNTKIPIDKFSNIILNLKTVEQNILISLSDNMAIASFVSAFY
jgi:replication factor C subunit 3/5